MSTDTDAMDDGTVLHATAMADLPALAALLERACTRVEAGAEVRSELRLAVEEVFTNILRHGYRGSSGPVTVTVAATPLAITVTLADTAPDFDPASLPAPDLSSGWQVRQIGGLGWHLVQQVMDEVHRAPGRHGGNVYTLVKRIPVRSAPDALISRRRH